MEYKAIIFDMNGTLLRDSELHEIAWIEVARQLRSTPLSVAEFQSNIHGLTNKGIVSYLLEKDPEPGLLDEIVELKEGMYRNMCIDNGAAFKLAPGVERFLNRVKTAKIPITIATGSYKKNVAFYFKHLRLYQWFDINKVILDDGSYPGKPEPFVYEKAAKALQVAPENCVVFEDSYSGIQAAVSAGIGRIVAVDPGLDPEKVKSIGAVYSMKDGFLDIDLSILDN